MNEKGTSHIEVILSFLIFLGFVIFALYFFSPFDSSKIIDSSLSYALTEIQKNASVDIESYSIILDKTTKPPANDLIEVKIIGSNAGDAKRLRVESPSGEVVGAEEIADEKIRFELKDEFYQSGNGAVFAKFSEEFSAPIPPSGSNPAGEGKYSISSSDSIDLLSENRLLIINSTYYSDYNDLKRRFNLPERANFGFIVSFDSGYFIQAQKETLGGVEIFSEIIRVKVLRKTGSVEFAELMVRVW